MFYAKPKVLEERISVDKLAKLGAGLIQPLCRRDFEGLGFRPRVPHAAVPSLSFSACTTLREPLSWRSPPPAAFAEDDAERVLGRGGVIQRTQQQHPFVLAASRCTRASN